MDQFSKHEALVAQARKRHGADLGALETLQLLQTSVARINNALDQFLHEYGLSSGRFTVLLLLLDEPEGLPPSVIAERAGVTRATITGLLDGLERDSLVVRHRDRGDRRSVTVRPTQVAKGLLDGVLGELFKRINGWFGGVSGGGRRTLEGILAMIIDRLPGDENPADPLPESGLAPNSGSSGGPAA